MERPGGYSVIGLAKKEVNTLFFRTMRSGNCVQCLSCKHRVIEVRRGGNDAVKCDIPMNMTKAITEECLGREQKENVESVPTPNYGEF